MTETERALLLAMAESLIILMMTVQECDGLNFSQRISEIEIKLCNFLMKAKLHETIHQS